MTAPYLTPRGRALLPAMADKVRDGLKDALGPKCDMARISGGGSDAFAAKVLGCAVTPLLDPDDEALHDIVAALMKGALSPEEVLLFDRELPRMRGLAAQSVSGARDLSPTAVRAALLAKFINARSDEGTMGENLHIGVRRVFERFFQLFDGAQTIANRAGFYRPQDLFEPAYAAANSLVQHGPTEPGERLRR